MTRLSDTCDVNHQNMLKTQTLLYLHTSGGVSNIAPLTNMGVNNKCYIKHVKQLPVCLKFFI